MAEYGCTRCLFCHTGKENEVVRMVTGHSWGRALFPQRNASVGPSAEKRALLQPSAVFHAVSP